MLRGKRQNHSRTPSDGVLTGHLDDWAEIAVDYLDGNLDDQTESAVKAHIDSCAECAARLQLQRAALTDLRRPELAEIPTELEEKIISGIHASLLPTVLTAPEKGRDSSRLFRTWAPVAVAATFVLAVGLGLGIGLQQDGDGVTTAADSVAEAERLASTEGSTEIDAGSALATSDEASLAAESGAEGGDPQTMGISDFSLTAAPDGAGTPDVSGMAGALANADDTAYFWFSAPEDDVVTTAQADAIAQEITADTGLQLMGRQFGPGVKAFAAFVPREDCTAIVSLLARIGFSMDLSLSLSTNPSSSAVMAWTEAMVEEKYPVAELSATPAEAAETTDWMYTTSTVTSTTKLNGSPAQTTTTTTSPIQTTSTARTTTTVDATPTHVLVVILIAVDD